MAAYTLIGSDSIVQVLTPTVSQEMVAATISTEPHGVIATVLVSKTAFDSNQAAPELTAFADSIEAILAQGRAIGGTGTSSLDANGLQQYFVTFTVGYNAPGAPAGAVTVDVDVPVGLLTQSDPAIERVVIAEAEALVNKAYASLQSLAGG